MKKILLMTVLSFSAVANAQMIDALGQVAVGGVMQTNESTQLKLGFEQVKQVNLINKINMLVMDATFKENKEGLKKSDFSYDLSPLKWDIAAQNNTDFSLSFEDIDKQFCTKLINSLQYKSVLINNIPQKECQEKNNIKFIF